MNLQGQGLYDQHEKHFVALDCIIFGFDQEKLQILLIQRAFEPEGGKWSLMGGFLRSDECVEAAAQRVLYELTGLSQVYMEQLYAYGDIHRDPVARTISLAYYALIKTDQYDKELARVHQAKWFPVSQMPALIFDHEQMVKKALARLRRRARTQPIGFELLSDQFTIPQLRKLYEAIHDKPFDHRNFSKKINSMEWLVKLKEKDKSSSRKGAFFYRFDKERYQHLLSDGTDFEF